MKRGGEVGEVLSREEYLSSLRFPFEKCTNGKKGNGLNQFCPFLNFSSSFRSLLDPSSCRGRRKGNEKMPISLWSRSKNARENWKR